MPSCQLRHDPYLGTRVGEASHPGPDDSVHAHLEACGDPSLHTLHVGALIDIVVRYDRVTCFALWHHEECIAKDLPFWGLGTYTLYGAIFAGFLHKLPVITGNPDTQIVARPPSDAQTFWRLKELCAGLGGIAVGMEATGGIAIASVDKCDLACQTLSLNNSHVIQGDLNDRSTRIKAHLVNAGVPCILGAGIPCQGYSTQGMQRGFDDPRSRTLIPVLKLLWHTQAYGLILECVSAITGSKGATDVLRSFTSQAGFQMSEIKLELADQWPAKRFRWWAAIGCKTLAR